MIENGNEKRLIQLLREAGRTARAMGFELRYTLIQEIIIDMREHPFEGNTNDIWEERR